MRPPRPTAPHPAPTVVFVTAPHVAAPPAPPAARADRAGSGSVVGGAMGAAGLRAVVVANLAVYLRALHEELGLLTCAADAQAARNLEDFFAIGTGTDPRESARGAAARLGQFGVHYLGADQRADFLSALKRDPDVLRRRIAASESIDLAWIDACGADRASADALLRAASRILVCVADPVELEGVQSVWEQLARLGVPRDRARILFLGVDRASRAFADGTDPLAWLRAEATRRGWPQLRSFVSDHARARMALRGDDARARTALRGDHARARTALRGDHARARTALRGDDAVEWRASILHRQRGTALDRQLRALAEEISHDLALAALWPARRRARAVRREAARRLAESGAGGWRVRVLARAGTSRSIVNQSVQASGGGR